MKLHNLMEDIVSSCLKDLIQRRNILNCDETALQDIMAIALNHLPNKYVVSSKGEMFVKTQLRSQVEIDVYRELSNAMEIVLSSPRESEFEDK